MCSICSTMRIITFKVGSAAINEVEVICNYSVNNSGSMTVTEDFKGTECFINFKRGFFLFFCQLHFKSSSF